MSKKKDQGGPGAGGAGAVVDVPFHEATRRRYLNYALSVITSRALPDVRDGLKPVQRRILFTMHHDLHLHPDAKAKKCAAIVGDCMGKYHPHGDSAIYETLVRMAQDFNLRYPLVDGQGNFGSIDGDPAAAMRYTEARLQPITSQVLDDLGKETVDFRDNYDGNHQEPCVLPARIPQLLVNGATGIAVGLATSIPPHNLKEVADACVALIEDRAISVAGLLKHVKGPDFPVGGLVLNSKAEIRQIYEEGQGSIRVRGEYQVEEGDRGALRIVVHSIPYLTETDKLVQRIAELIIARKVHQMVDVRNESTEKDGIRIVVELKKGSDPALVMAYLYKNTPLQTNFGVNLTCLVPGESAAMPPAPRRLDLKTMLVHFIDFRFQVVERRFQHELRLLKERIHILEGFRKILDALDEAIKIIRASEGKKDAAEKLIARFKIDDLQADAILELKLYKLARLEILIILEELRQKRKAAKEIEEILASRRRIWTVVKKEIQEAGQGFADPRRTKIGGRGEAEEEYDEEAFIADEDATILLSRDGWVRRVQRVTDLSKVRLRQDDELLAIGGGNTRSAIVFFSNFGVAYTLRVNDIPPSPRGFGDPVQRLFKFRDGERVVAAVSLDKRFFDGDEKAIGKPSDKPGTIPRWHALAVASSGYGVRFGLLPFAEPSTRAGRRFARVKQGEEITEVVLVTGDEVLITASQAGRALLCKTGEINFLGGPGRGVKVLKLAKDDRVIGFAVSRAPNDGLVVIRDNGSEIAIRPRSYKVASRAGKGFEVIKRGRLMKVQRPPAVLPEFLRAEGAGEGASEEDGGGHGARGHGGNGNGNGNGNSNGGGGHGEREREE
jgi:DNA gyrase subunit A